MTLSEAARSVWAKSSRTDDSWLPLHTHLEDAAALAPHLWDDWLPASVKRVVADALPGGEADGRLLLTWAAGIHDIGKATPAFAVQVPALADRMRARGLEMPYVIADRGLVRHELAGHVLLSRWLRTRGWQRPPMIDTYAVLVGSHHGRPPTTPMIRCAEDSPRLLGEHQWAEVQVELLEHMAATTGVAGRLAAWSRCPLPSSAQVLLSAAVILADWIASDEALFPYADSRPPRQRAAAAWAGLDLPRPWHALLPPSGDALFTHRFTLPAGARPHRVQQLAVEVAEGIEGPALVVVEAPMGAGKTEAALAVAEVLAHRTGAGGVFVALPTMATSDAMFARVRRWLERLPVEGDDVDLTLLLAHSRAALNDEARSLWRPGAPAAVEQDDLDQLGAPATRRARAVAHSWLRGRRKGVLSSFVVGTIDQVLFAALKSKHLALRHLSLAGKVVIVDEVHAVDVYSGSYLERVLHWLGAHGVATVLLSATLPSAQRRALVAAYDAGRAIATGQQVPAEQVYDVLDGDIGYPVLTASTGGQPRTCVAAWSGEARAVAVERLADDDEALTQALRTALADGGCVGVVRNTVARAQATYAVLRAHFGGDVVLLHSRFVAVDRAEREQDLVARLGPPEAVSAGGRGRPERLVVVGTQVIEQSLDIDFDLLVTDLAPVDLVLQRLGRLHRHQRGQGQADRPAPLRSPRCLVSGVSDWSATPPAPVPGSVTVYGRSFLLRACMVLAGPLERGRLTLPDDIAPLVQRAYAPDPTPPPGWEAAFAAAEQQRADREAEQRRRAGTYQLGQARRPGRPLLGWVEAGVGEVDDDSPRAQAQVRDTEDTVEVVVVQRLGDEIRVLPWATGHAGRPVATEGAPPDDVARAVATCTLRLPVQLSRGTRADALIRHLERSCFPGWQSSPWLDGQLPLVLDEQLTAELPGHRVTYGRDRGLIVETLEAAP